MSVMVEDGTESLVESSASYAHRFPYRAVFHILDDCSDGQPSVPTLQ